MENKLSKFHTPKWARGLTWKVTLLMVFLKVLGGFANIPTLSSIPWWAWSPFEISVLFLFNWSVWLIGVSWMVSFTATMLLVKLEGIDKRKE